MSTNGAGVMDVERQKTAEMALALGNWSLYADLCQSLLPPGEYVARFDVADDGSASMHLVHKATQVEISVQSKHLLGALCLAAHHMSHDPVATRRADKREPA